MLSIRLKTIASLVDKDKSVIDIGTDHAYIPIYLIENNITNKVCAADISEKVLESAKTNIASHNLSDKISICLSDGFQNIEEKFDIAIISGMGTSTIKKILDQSSIPDTLIIQSNNNLGELRLHLNKLGYKIEKEIVIYDDRYYSIIKFKKGKEILKPEEILFGKSNNIEYYKYLLEKYNELYIKSKKKEFLDHCEMLEKLIEKIQA